MVVGLFGVGIVLLITGTVALMIGEGTVLLTGTANKVLLQVWFHPMTPIATTQGT